jgi:hypothetical protein
MPAVHRVKASAQDSNAAIVIALLHTQSRWIRKSEYSFASGLPPSGVQL